MLAFSKKTVKKQHILESLKVVQTSEPSEEERYRREMMHKRYSERHTNFKHSESCAEWLKKKALDEVAELIFFLMIQC